MAYTTPISEHHSHVAGHTGSAAQGTDGPLAAGTGCAGYTAGAAGIGVRELADISSAVATALAEGGIPRPARPAGYTPVERSLYRQFTESTGADICDSGSAYGRNWERNRRAGDLRSQPYATVDLGFGLDSPSVTVSAFRRLSDSLMCAREMNRLFGRFNARHDPDNRMSWLDVSEAFAERIGGGGDSITYYLSYSDEYSVISQDLQFVGFEAGDGGEYALLQMHGGADARAGYTRPVAYEVESVGSLIDDLRRWSASCSCRNGSGDGSPDWDCLRLDMRCGEFEPDGLDEWPERWAVSPDGSARCGVCREDVLLC